MNYSTNAYQRMLFRTRNVHSALSYNGGVDMSEYNCIHWICRNDEESENESRMNDLAGKKSETHFSIWINGICCKIQVEIKSECIQIVFHLSKQKPVEAIRTINKNVKILRKVKKDYLQQNGTRMNSIGAKTIRKNKTLCMDNKAIKVQHKGHHHLPIIICFAIQLRISDIAGMV